MRYALGIEYDGSGFRGWQRQRYAVRTVQQCLESALSKVADHPVKTVCAGRTDTGVHAQAQVVHFDSAAQRSDRSWVLGVNSNLPDDISVLWARPVDAHFSARFSARARRYRYTILNRAVRSPLLRHSVTWYRHRLDETWMNLAGAYLLGEHDFSSFRSYECQAKSPVRTIYVLHVRRDADLLFVEVEANAFLHHMVRNIVGVLMAVGRAEREPQWAAQVLAARDRAKAGVTAPAQGLSLIAVRYADECLLPDISALPEI